jgi:RimJ/RimL family protein N-acetyltransferase/catechol 2,3-dioxygenase-like lactoylglutathione lyase family enzyme
MARSIVTAELQTTRLILQPLSAKHADDLFHVLSDEATMRYWHHPPHRESCETTAMIWSMLASEQACWWAILLRENNRAIGYVGYLGTTIPGMGYVLHSKHWRQGYGTEAVNTALEHGFTVLGLNRVELWINNRNVASQRLAYKVGFVQRGQFSQRYPTHETLVFGLRADEWAAKTQKPVPILQRAIPIYAVHPVLPVRDVAESITFYRDCLGFYPGYVSGDPPDFAIMSRGEWSSEQANLQLSKSSELTPVRLFIMMASFIDRLHEEFCENGVTIISTPSTHPWGIRDFSIQDNSGHHITFGANA